MDYTNILKRINSKETMDPSEFLGGGGDAIKRKALKR